VRGVEGGEGGVQTSDCNSGRNENSALQRTKSRGKCIVAPTFTTAGSTAERVDRLCCTNSQVDNPYINMKAIRGEVTIRMLLPLKDTCQTKGMVDLK
jgi:hypothetical protein